MSRGANDKALVLGAEPRVNLLPPEVAAQAADRLLRKKLLLATAGTLVLVVLGIGGAALHATNSALQLASAQADTTALLAEQAEYVSVRQVQSQVDTALAARAVGGWTEIDWKAYLQSVRSALPSDVGIDAVSVDSTSPLSAYAQPTAPLQSARVATLTVTLASPGLPAVPQWLTQLQELPGMADAAAGSITAVETGGYTVVVTMHINSDAFTGRFLETTGSD
jgi:Tfp pilus assembly protein PilN